ncbi:MAG: polyphosphate kinase 2 family protein [Gemmatimonadota bacterium]
MPKPTRLEPVPRDTRIRLRDKDANPGKGILRGDDAVHALIPLTSRLAELQSGLYAEGKRALLVVLQGRDAAGKDGTINHVFGPLNPQGCIVTSFKAPSTLELSHDYLWRIHGSVPPRGAIGIFNRSHYEDVLIVRVHKLVPRKVWSRRYEQINDFERMLTENGVVIVKFMLHVSREEQRARLEARLSDPTKNWKFEAGDLKERDLWDDYTEAYEEMLRRCSTKWAPWYVVPADHKSSRDLLIADCLVRTLEAMHPVYPRADPEVLRLAADIK